MTSKQFKVVPWYDRREWERVYKGIFSGRYTDMEWALGRLTAWGRKQFCSDCGLPGPAEATAALLRAQLWRARHDWMGASRADLEPQYGLALVKVVSEILEPVQLKTGCGMRDAALNQGIPEWVVDLRNETAHASSMAFVEVLHSASVLLLRWLRQHYWDVVRADFEVQDGSSVTPKVSEELVFTWLIQYRDTNVQILSQGLRKSNKAAKDVLLARLSQISTILPTMCTEVIKHLVSKDCLLLEKEADLATIERAKVFETKAARCPLPPRLKNVWAPLVTLLRNDVQYLAEELMKVQGDGNRSDIEKYLAAAWLLHVLKSSENVCLLKDNMSFDTVPLRSHLYIPKLLSVGVKHTGCYTAHMMKGLLASMNPPLPEKNQYNLLALVAIHSGSTIDEEKLTDIEHNSEAYTYTSEDLLEPEEEESTSEFLWKQPSSPIAWQDTPVGKLPHWKYEAPDLTLTFKELEDVTSQAEAMESTTEGVQPSKDPTDQEPKDTLNPGAESQQLLESVHGLMRVLL